MKKTLLILLFLILISYYPVQAEEVNITHLTGKEALELIQEDFEITGYSGLTYYEVKPGDSLFWLAIRYDTTVELLRQINRLQTDEIIVGQKLLIPDDNGRQYIYEVQPGDTLFVLARRFNTTVSTLREINNLRSDILYPGQILYLQEQVYPELIEYIIKPGDSLYMIAKKFDTTVSRIVALNNLESYFIYAGQKIKIPAPDYNQQEYNLVLDYQIQSGDSFASLALRFGLSITEIRNYNNLDYLRIGQTINLPFKIPQQEEGYKLDVNRAEMDLLARAVHSEARGEPFRGQVAVAAVILNRIYHPFFPDNVNDVIFQPWQFTAVHDGQFWLTPGQNAYVAARAALSGWDPSRGAIFYYNPDTASSGWIFHREVVIKIGEHYFAVKV